MEKEEKPSYYAILPADVRYDNNLSAREKLLYAEITALSNKEGCCWASNTYFANLYSTTNRTIISCINNLEKHKYIRKEFIYKKNSKEVEKRLIYPMTKFSLPSEKNFTTPHEENFTDNNTSVNTINLIKEEIYKEEKKNSNSDYEFDFEKYAIDDLEEFGKVIQDWISYKTERHNTYTKTGFKTFVKKLIEYSNGEYEKAQEIVDTSIANNYLGIFPLKRRM